MQHHYGRTFADQRVTLDGQSYENCVFERVTFEFGGGACEFVGNTVRGTYGLRIVGDLARSLETLRVFGEAAGSAILGQIVSDIKATLVRPTPAFVGDFGIRP